MLGSSAAGAWEQDLDGGYVVKGRVGENVGVFRIKHGELGRMSGVARLLVRTLFDD